MFSGRFRKWFNSLFSGSNKTAARVTDEIFAEGMDADSAWDTANACPRDPAEAFFAGVYEARTSKGNVVDKILSTKKSANEILKMSREVKMKLIVGLGNPGAKYVGTRHNVGYEILAELGRRHGAGRVKSRFQGELLEGNVAGTKVVFLSPVTFMNLSGRCVRPCFDFYKLAKEDVLILCDDVNLPIGKLRIRAKGSAGGQKGLADIIRALGGDDIPRLRVGIGEPPSGWDMADYVLAKFPPREVELIRVAVMTAADAVETWVASGLQNCMDRYNA